jgi:hypothetical protein
MSLIKIFYRTILFGTTLTVGAQAAQIGTNQPVASQQEPQANSQKAQIPTSLQDVQTEKIETPSVAPAKPATLTNEAGSMKAEEVKALLKDMRASEYRINDLLTDVRPENWKLAAPTLDSFNQTLSTLRAQMSALETWRAQFEQRTDSMYLGYQTYTTIDSVLPRLYGVAQSISEHENKNYGAQFSKAGDQLSNLQQTMGTYVGSLLHNQDQLLQAASNNLASCQQDLGVAMRGTTKRAIPVKNTRVGRPLKRTTHRAPSAASEKQPTH